MTFLVFVFFIVIGLGIWTLLGAGVLFGLAAAGLAKFSWAGALGIGLALWIVMGLFDRKSQ